MVTRKVVADSWYGLHNFFLKTQGYVQIFMQTYKYKLPLTLMVLLTLYIFTAYSAGEITNIGDKVTTKAPFLHSGAIPDIVIFHEYEKQPLLTTRALQKIEHHIVGDETDIYVRLKNSAGVQVDSWVGQEPGLEIPVLSDAFYREVCHQDILILVIKKRVNTAVSRGERYFNALFNPVSGEWLMTLESADIEDIHTGERFENQIAQLARLQEATDVFCSEVFLSAKAPEALN